MTKFCCNDCGLELPIGDGDETELAPCDECGSPNTFIDDEADE